ncbi:hypothetical protein TWF569_008877 [Orbilia oligospora]|uniref:Uncharacterized protein n=1 Tax=Orbilia oligospora TaxID=2813651 RepID=A0A7C8NGK0_ORBOL|nr:hypothetical protein TWF706_007492 [Orbilia oligospora]KAF3105748.1 hypothetical protein TWF103_006451 [Orbilia oligospora]KAF3108036.1 hypothetical protein TWF102_011517 [Orbilia oligospora]KAF3139841.1 hypothetical protein TWF703_003419 [Orbilia oligospora]KAF3155507.1 hypothetical protein TWF569_008877 [Orbilia oligospora]
MKIAWILVSSLALVSGLPIPNPAWALVPPSPPSSLSSPSSPTLFKELILPPLPPPLFPSPLQPTSTKMRNLKPRSPFFGYHFRYYTPGAVRTPVLRYSPYRGFYKRKRRSEGSKFIHRDSMDVKEEVRVLGDPTDLGGTALLSPSSSSSSSSSSYITPTSTNSEFEKTTQTGMTSTTIPTHALKKREVVTITEYPVKTEVKTIKIPKSMRSTITKTETVVVTTTATVAFSPSSSPHHHHPPPPPASPPAPVSKSPEETEGNSTKPTQSSDAEEVVSTTIIATTITTTINIPPSSTKDKNTSSSSIHLSPKPTSPPPPSSLPSSLEFLRPPTRYFEPPGITPCPCPSMVSQIQLTNKPYPIPELPPPPEKKPKKNPKKREGLSSLFDKILSFINPHHSPYLQPPSNPTYKIPKRDEKENEDPGRKIELEKKPTCPCLNPSNEIPDPRDDKRKRLPFYRKKRAVKREVDEDFEPEREERVKRWRG